MPQVNAAVVGVHNGTMVPTLNYFPNIIHPIEESSLLWDSNFKNYAQRQKAGTATSNVQG